MSEYNIYMVNIYLTGSSGFLGKCIVDVFHKQDSISKIYCPIREKKGFSGNERFIQLFKNKNKCSFIEPSEFIPSDTSIIILCAFSVSFNTDIKNTVHENVLPIYNRLIEYKTHKKLRIIFISTAYVYEPNIQHTNLPIQVDYCPIDIMKRILSEKLNWEDIKKMTKNKYHVHNTYIYSKILTESLLVKLSNNFVIVRPSQISISTNGKHTCKFGPLAIHKTIKTPFIRIINEKGYNNVIPVDIVAKTILKSLETHEKYIMVTSKKGVRFFKALQIYNKFFLNFNNPILFYIFRTIEMYIYKVLSLFNIIRNKDYIRIKQLYLNYDFFLKNHWFFPITNNLYNLNEIKHILLCNKICD